MDVVSRLEPLRAERDELRGEVFAYLERNGPVAVRVDDDMWTLSIGEPNGTPRIEAMHAKVLS